MFKNYTFDKKDVAQCHTFEIHDLDLSIVNGIRRTILTDIPVVGFSGEEQPSIEVITNTGRLHNEIMLHRLGLIPFHVGEIETDAFVEGQYTVELKKHNSGDDMMNVTSHDFKVFKDDKPMTDQQVHQLFPTDMVSRHPILITRLRPQETLHVKGAAVKQTARFHAGFSPVSLCTFSYMQDPQEAAKKDNILDKERAYLKNAYGDPIAFKFEIEPKVSLSPRYLVSKAIDILISKLTLIQQELYVDDTNKVTIEDGDTGGVNFTIQDEDDTIGNILQSWMHVHNVRGGKHSPSGSKVTYVGYYCPHPLDSTVVINIRMEEGSQKDHVDMLAAATRAIITQLQDILTQWLQFAPKN